ncbi:leucyl/phenylalanyl-tRNA--protein transferase [Haliscomenobacter sp.]|uniref:leucyl/phenylalanyl-tRNA--protein transferase n=1 Tax=Haliscomenobacter sp. TaxID=2717303 RepID=UPI003BA87E25
MPVFWLDDQSLEFPAPELATPEGILAVGGDLSPARLLEAYAGGIFPWFNEGDPILWWSPDPRFVLFPDELVVSKSMRPYFNQKKFQVSFDQDFEGVMRGCQQSNRNGQSGDTWITEDMIQAYVQVHQLGYAHSVEVWQEGNLVGGLYGISLGKIFFGESMFARVSNASKFGFITLVQKLREKGFTLIDCQQQTQHLGSLGAKPISRKSFLNYLQENKKLKTLTGSWTQVLAE